jgi:hypothetical protein
MAESSPPEAGHAVGSSHQGEHQLRGQAYMQAQAEDTLESPLLKMFGSTPLQWYCLNDIVMGGMSSSNLQLTSSGALEFSGVINTQGGGFAGCRTTTREHMATPGLNGVWLTVSGEHTHAMKFTMGAGSEADENDPTGKTLGVQDLDAERARMDKGSSKGKGKGKSTMAERWSGMTPDERRLMLQSISWQCSFAEQLAAPGSNNSEPRRFFLPFSSFSASLYGQPLPNLRSPDLSTLTHIGMSVGIFDAESKARLDQYTDGPFLITLHSVEFE